MNTTVHGKYCNTVQFRSIRQSQVTGPPDVTKCRIHHRSPPDESVACHTCLDIVILRQTGSKSDEISPLPRPSSQGDKIKISSGGSQCHMGDKSIEIVQYLTVTVSVRAPMVRRDFT